MRIKAEMNEQTANLTLTRAEALVFCEFLSRCDQNAQFEISDQAGQLLLWHLHGALERTLQEPKVSDYLKKPSSARAAVRCSA